MINIADFPENDGTDAAHPAWWRGQQYGFDAMIREVNKILDGEPITGACSEPWQTLRIRLAVLLARVENAGQWKPNYFMPLPTPPAATKDEL